jgi:UDP-N-acetylmuramoyl-tripeptide--D-alanyl-D-alanine ligase
VTPIPANVAEFSLEDAVLATSGRAVLRAPSVPGRVRGVCTDTRGVLTDGLFVALSGERFDGHRFAMQAWQQGARLLLVERELDEAVNQLVVPSTRRALGQLARLHRRRWGGRVIAIAGSAGKTSTKSATGALLQALLPDQVWVTPGNLNNDIGVPMVLLGLQERHRECVLEIGTNQTGEVPWLASVAEPQISVLTLIDLEHTAGLGGIDAIEAEEGAVLQAAANCAIGNGDDARVSRQVSQAKCRHLRYGFGKGADYRAVEVTSRGLLGTRLRVRRPDASQVEFDSPLFGKPGTYSALAALAVAELVCKRPLEPAELANALAREDARVSGRLRPTELRPGLLVIDDTYNANPASMRAAIETAAELAQGRNARLHLVLGEMRELGASSQPEHRALGEFAARFGAASLVAVAGDARWIAESAAGGHFVEAATSVLAWLEPRLGDQDVVLVKGSRGVKTEQVVEGLRIQQGTRA